ncbi:carbohydrate-binding protein [Streptantibioticus silvisoli]|uniref:Carbohydrate-binding protein n=1 Tax=Streptantibioticus silvisoli TaxID=2705255 RepID=A0ABT6VUC6_9ACTN|nr:carbohydrate-binding protein [Streptantibioticus silvisoli]MDI5961765.1 carbohydrate-binding protein [Streptantibioticus silvisoli]
MNISRRALLTGAGAAALGGVTAAARRGGGTQVPLRVAQVAAAAASISPTSRNSVWTRSGAGPLYWSAYSWDYTNNATLPESVWQQNVDWVAATFKSSGYTMCCTDGWVDYTQQTNANGYILSYSDDWANDWQYWANYCSGKGLKLGVYYNPLWVSAAAAGDSTKTVTGMPGVTVGSLVDSGDFLNSNGELYWVDVTKNGAKQFVQGYVNYFKNLGVAYLRTDFWAWYEAGATDGQGGIVAHGSTNYATALEWIAEAAGDTMEVSVVMPNMYDNGAREVLYGDMVRINNDATTGGWTHLSGGRQSWQDSWSQWDNAFSGFTGWAHRSGRGQLILDGDFLMMNSFASDAERQTAINLFTVAGSPVAISDRVDNIGANASFYTNSDVLSLHNQGLTGKPYFYNGSLYSVDGTSRDTERWMGQLPDGSWAVALFNRNDTNTVTKSVSFGTDLGIVGAADVKDMWSHADLGSMTSFSASLAPHASRLVHVVPAESTKRYQAAFAAWGGGANFNNDHTGYSAMGFVDKLEAAEAGANVTFAVQAATAGSHTVHYRYANGGGTAGTVTVEVQTANRTVVEAPVTVSFPATADWNTWATVTGTLTLAAGLNLITIARTTADAGAINLNYIEVS